MRALFRTRIEHLDPGDFVKVECVRGHVELLPRGDVEDGTGWWLGEAAE